MTVESVHGDVTVPEEPERIVVLQNNLSELLVSLDVDPTVLFYNNEIDSVDGLTADDVVPYMAEHYPEDLIVDPSLAMAGTSASIEAIAAYEPDLIIGTDANIDSSVYEQISKIAPTYAAANAGREDWTLLLEDLGTLTGQADQVQGVIDGVEDQYAQLREELPGLQGGTVSFVAYFPEGEFSYGSSDWVRGLGLEPAASEDEVGNLNTAGRLSLENVTDLDADVLLIQPIGENLDADLESDPRFTDLPAWHNDAVIYIDAQVGTTAAMPSPYSLMWSIEQIRPELEAIDLGQ